MIYFKLERNESITSYCIQIENVRIYLLHNVRCLPAFPFALLLYTIHLTFNNSNSKTKNQACKKG